MVVCVDYENGVSAPGLNNGVLDGDISANPMMGRRSSARIKKLEGERALRSSLKKEALKSTEPKMAPKVVRKRMEKKKTKTAMVVPAVDENKGSEAKLESRESKKSVKNANGVGKTVLAETATGTGGEKSEKSASALVTETLRTFNKHYLHFVQEEEKRCRRVESKKTTAKASKKRKAPEDNAKKGSKKQKVSEDEVKKRKAPEDNAKKGSKKQKVSEDEAKRSSKRPDLKAISKMMETNTILNPTKRFGSIEGVDVGHQFFSRAEMVAVGFHSHWLNGIDYIGRTGSKGKNNKRISQVYTGYTLPLAVAIVLSGQYEDDLDNCEDVVYTGQGGNNLLGNKRQVKDQVMKRGNLALKNCIDSGTPVRVVRGHQSSNSYVGKVYTYDGLYKVVGYWAEKGVSGFTVYKFRLKRLEGQPLLTTGQVLYTRGRIPNSVSEIRGLVCEDISGGLEKIPIPATNLVDEPAVPPTGFTYRKNIKVSENVKLPKPASGCSCKGDCTDPKICACARLNGSDFPYVHKDGGRIVEPKAVVFECGPNCGCGPDCVNRTSQKPIRYRLEVFRTPKKGWGVRSWDYIPSGAPICEYVGVLMKADDINAGCDDTYIFDIDCLQTMKGLDGRERRLGDVPLPMGSEKGDDQKLDSAPEFCLDAGSTGNIARFINHSCQPNLFVQCVLSSHHDIKLARVVLFAADNIPPLKELSYDYGYAVDSVMGPDGKTRQVSCFCGAADCRKRLL